ncbi:hypothetical protein Y032_0007g3434 [Ancylostoma ceylanicum]|uniref:Uncharacterized protein n=1 Tax=Ancylostoma ceylanicum TaxID=53326 RepID=A0A016VN89_9BILA|nr:hypothetical protein Y032_0007g3434 [Ancylostoma ceylanicum]
MNTTTLQDHLCWGKTRLIQDGPLHPMSVSQARLSLNLGILSSLGIALVEQYTKIAIHVYSANVSASSYPPG